MTRISVVMSVYNGERYLAQAINSILNQTYTDFEFIILDDCSTDSTTQILQTYTDTRLKIVRNPQNLGLTKSLNLGLQMAQGDYIARQDADDISMPTRLAEQVEFLDAHPEIVLVSGNIEQIDADGKKIGFLNRAAPSDWVRWYMLFYNHVSGHSQVMFRRAAALQVGGYNEERRYSQDYELWLKLLTLGEIAMLPRTWLQWRTHGANISTQKFAEQENLSLRDSQHALSTLLGRELELTRVAHLRGFWLEPFPPVADSARIHTLIQEIYGGFSPSLFTERGQGGEVTTAIAERFFRWARSVSIRRNPLDKLRLWSYAWRWQLR